MSLIGGKDWERAVGRYLDKVAIPGVTCKRSGAPSERTGSRCRETDAGPADFQVVGDGWRAALEVKKCDGRFPFSKVRLSQAEDMDASHHGLVLLRVAGDGPHAPDLVFALDWLDLGPEWWTWRLGEDLPADGRRLPGTASLDEGDCRRMAVAAFGADGVRLVMDDHGTWTCPPMLPDLLRCWGRL